MLQLQSPSSLGGLFFFVRCAEVPRVIFFHLQDSKLMEYANCHSLAQDELYHRKILDHFSRYWSVETSFHIDCEGKKGNPNSKQNVELILENVKMFINIHDSKNLGIRNVSWNFITS
jgi:hypothetical protein